MRSLDETDRRLLTAIQKEFPLDPRPYALLGRDLGISEEETLNRTNTLRDKGPIRQISAIFNTRSLGYRSTLAAFKIPPERLETAADIVSAHPGVSHNYSREHEYDLWFTIAVPPTSRLGLEKTVELLGAEAGAESVLMLPTVTTFKIGVTLDMTKQPEPAGPWNDDAGLLENEDSPPPDPGDSKASPLTPGEIELVRNLQEDIPRDIEPFSVGANTVGLTVKDYLREAESFVEAGRMRRFAAVLHHREAGFTANAMGVWSVPQERIEETGRIMASFRDVTHCYQRPTHTGWPYNLFTMVHATSAEGCERILDAIAEATGVKNRDVLYSVKDFKKVRVKYFTPEIEEWEKSRLGRRS